MTITVLVGRQNEGKTLGMTRLILPDFIMGRDIYTNTPFGFPHTLINKDFLMDMVEKGISLKDITYALDEFWLWIDARRRETLLSYFYMQSSKDNANLVITTQTAKQVDTRLRDALHFYGECERKILYKGKFYNVPKEFRHLRKELPEELQERLFIHIKMYVPRTSLLRRGIHMDDFKYIGTKVCYAKAYYSVYDTERKIKIKL